MKLNLSHIEKSYGGFDILKDVSLQVKNKEKIALIGRNGCGKTTLLKIIAGLEDIDGGKISRQPQMQIGYLSQIAFEDESRSVFAELDSVFAPVRKIESEMNALAENLQDDKDLERYDYLQGEFERLKGYEIEAEIKNVFYHFGFELEDLAKPLSDFSSGQKTRIALVKLLLQKPDILLLDEPTNHLDLESTIWLENYIKAYPRAVVLVCHDREFIDHVADEIIEIEYGTSRRYVGSYDQYLEAKEKYLRENKKAYERQQAEIERLQNLIERFKNKPSKAAFARSRAKMLERMDKVEKARADTQSMKASFVPARKGGSDVLSMQDLTVGYDVPLYSLSLDLHAKDRIGIVGRNGMGKSALIKTLARQIPPLSGHFYYGFQIDPGYFDQDSAQQSGSQSILEELWALDPQASGGEIRNILAAFLFKGEEVFKSLDELSGGEKVRLALAKLMMEEANFLLLDEPTNHLDIAGKEALEKALEKYEGTLLFVSHDRRFLKKMASSILEIDEQPRLYHETYEGYLEKKAQEKQSQSQDSQSEKRKQAKNAKTQSIKKTKKAALKEETAAKGKKGLERQMKTIQNRIKTLETKISEKEEEIEKLEALRFEPEYYSDYKETEKLEKQIEQARKDLENYLNEWSSKSAMQEDYLASRQAG